MNPAENEIVRVSFVTLALILASCFALATGFRIEVTTQGVDVREMYLAYYLGNSQYVQDTAKMEGGHCVFQGDKPLNPGLYMLVIPPDNDYCQIAVGNNEDHIHVTLKGSVHRPASIEGSPESDLFYRYVDFLASRRPVADSLESAIQAAEGDSEKQRLRKHLIRVNAEVENYQDKILQSHPKSLTALMIKANQKVQAPEFPGTEDERQGKVLQFYKKHYFDNIPMRDDRLVRTPFLHEKVDYYMNSLTHQVPDSISKSIDFILNQFDPDGETFKYYLVYFLNTYAKSNVVGMDAVYVHIVEEYYSSGRAPWTEEEQLKKIVRNARKLKPILIGKIAPNLVMQDRAGNVKRLHDVEAQYTILYFWDPDCGHCKKSIPHLLDFYKAYKPRKDIQVFAVCTKLADGVSECWKAIDEREMGMFINVVDPYLKSRFKQIYDVRVTPQLFVLDADKRIVMKKIGAEQLPQVMEHLETTSGKS